MNVLSLFDGMSCGQIALERAGITVDNYYASEIDKYAIKVTMENYPDTVQLGSVENYLDWNLPKIDLLIGGSPCQGFSVAGKGLNFDDHRSVLFFYYVDILYHFKPKYFLLENVRMKQEHQNIFNYLLGVKPILICSSLVSAQYRKRLYWTNIPNIQQPDDKGITYQSILDSDNALIEKAYCLTATYFKKGGEPTRQYFFKSSQRPIAWLDNHNTRWLSPIECERLQTVPENYTNHVSNTQRYKMLGNGWTVDVICHIFRAMMFNELLTG